MTTLFAQFDDSGTELDGFVEKDEKGIAHHVVWEEFEISTNISHDTWHCRTHDRLYYGGCASGVDENE